MRAEIAPLLAVAALLVPFTVARGADDEVGPDDGPRTEAPPAYALDAKLLRRAYLDLFGRPPLADERERWGGKGLRELLEAELGSAAYWSHWLDEQLYYFLLIDNFRPRSERVVAIPADLAGGEIGVQDALHRIVLSSSFDQRNPGADTFVTVVMEQLLGITVQEDVRELEIGKSLYDGSPGRFLGNSGNSQADVVRIAIEDKRMLRLLVRREYQRLMRAEPAKKDVVAWARELAKDPNTFPELVRRWMVSPAYLERLATDTLQPNRMFVRSLYVDLLDREPDPEEARRLRDALDGLSDPAPLRSVLVRMMLDSGQVPLPRKESIEDPTQWVDGLFQRLLGRGGSKEELQAFVTAFHDPACKPTTVLYALLSHPEYHRY